MMKSAYKDKKEKSDYRMNGTRSNLLFSFVDD